MLNCPGAVVSCQMLRTALAKLTVFFLLPYLNNSILPSAVSGVDETPMSTVESHLSTSFLKYDIIAILRPWWNCFGIEDV